MATFPTLTPSSRTFTPGRHPHSEIPTLDGLQIRVRSSNVILEQRLRLTFIGLTESQMLSIRSHYIGQQGRFLSFAIPTSLLSGMASPASFTPSRYSWLYAGAPQVEDIPCAQRYNVTVELVTEPPEGVSVNGATGSELTMTARISPGVAQGLSLTAGFSLTVPTSFVGGDAQTILTSNTFTTLGGTSSFFNRYGFEFTVGATPLNVLKLGVVAANTTERVAIHRVSDGVAVASADIFSNATVVTADITPVTLAANTQYTISYQTPSATVRSLYRDITGNVFDSNITVDRYVFNASGTGMPTSTFSGTGLTAARFLFTA